MALSKAQKAAALKKAEALLASSKKRLAELEASQAASKEFIASSGLTPTPTVSTGLTKTEETMFGQTDTQIPTSGGAASGNVPTEKTVKSVEYRGAGPERIKRTTYSDDTFIDEEAGVAAPDTLSTLEAAKDEKTRVDNVAAITALLSSMGIKDLAGPITEAVTKGFSPDTIDLIMQDPNSKDPLAVAFQTRFPANKIRAAAGKPVLSPAEYLASEKTYTTVLRSYGVAGSATPAKLNEFIANDISPAEVSDRVSLAITRVRDADPETKKMLAEFYPMLSQSDIVNAMLNPEEGLPALQRKVQIAEIGGAALAQGLKTTKEATVGLTGPSKGLVTAMGAEELAGLGVTKKEAQAGFAQVAEVTPRAEFLSAISSGEDYSRLQAEQEVFKSSVEAKKTRQALTEQERARFAGSAGTTKGTLASQARGMF